MAMISIVLIASSFTNNPQRDLKSKKANLLIRQIGDKLLRQAGDDTSSVLPVTEIQEGTFLLKLENEFVFSHDSLMALTKSLLSQKSFPKGYTVTVHDCAKGDIVYGFQVNHSSPSILACKGRQQAAGCYTIEFAFPDLDDNASGEKDKRVQLEVDGKAVKQKPAELQAAPVAAEVTKSTGQLNPSKQTSPSENFNFTTIDERLVYTIFGSLTAIFGVMFFIRRRRNQPATQLPAIGKFLFNIQDHHLLLGSEQINLTDKECRVLEILHKNFGELIPRETLLQEVWINEGVITGRSLDMFVSKLRKKLGGDPELRITNVHGKGYRLEAVMT